MVRAMLLLSVLFCLWRWCIVAKRLDGSKCHLVGHGPGDIVSDGDLAPQKGAQPPILGPYLLWPNGWMDRDATWYGGSPWPRPHCVRWGPSSPTERDTVSPPLLCLCLLWPNSHPISATAELLFQLHFNFSHRHLCIYVEYVLNHFQNLIKFSVVHILHNFPKVMKMHP